jgi:hypothetical protein
MALKMVLNTAAVSGLTNVVTTLGDGTVYDHLKQGNGKPTATVTLGTNPKTRASDAPAIAALKLSGTPLFLES